LANAEVDQFEATRVSIGINPLILHENCIPFIEFDGVYPTAMGHDLMGQAIAPIPKEDKVGSFRAQEAQWTSTESHSTAKTVIRESTSLAS
jgi:hypothetical protein